MILIISGTNRPNSRTSLVADYVYAKTKEYDDNVHMISLDDVAEHLIHPDMYKAESMAVELKRIQDELFIPSNKLIIISPEYNGGFSGILKLFIDALSVRRYKETFSGKKVALIGVASGRGGNLRGLDHMSTFMHYLKMLVFPNKLPISQIESYIEDGKLKTEMMDPVNHLIRDFVNF